jgi:hypothetical protein
MGSQWTIYVSEPWEFVSLHGAGPFTATAQGVTTNGKEALLLTLLEASGGVRLEFLDI